MRKFELRETQAPEVLLTAAEAFPAFERAVLSARSEVWGGFRIFDLDTRLRSHEARRIGETWFDLMVHTLRRGVRVRMVLTDFDPVVRPRLHALTWRSVRQFHGAREIAGPKADLDIVPSLHSARTGLLPRLAAAPLALWTLRKDCRWLKGLKPDRRAAMLRDLPGLARYVRMLANGSVAPRYLSVPELFPATHHQKLAVIDRRKLYIGGIDLNERRYDTPEHDQPGCDTWQDVQMMLEGDVAEEAQAHLESFLSAVDGRSDPPPTRQLLRTLSRRRRTSRMHFGPKPVLSQILDAHRLLIRRSRRLIYLETQFLRDRSLTRALVEAARGNPNLGLILILPAAPEEVAFGASGDLEFRYGDFLQARCLRKVRGAFRTRAFIGTAAQPRPATRRYSRSSRERLRGAEIVYIHSKVSIFDDTGAIVSSANLNGRSLHWDTEAGVVLSTPADVAALRRKVFAHWLPKDAEEAYFDSGSAVPSWRRLAIRNARREPAEREGFVMPYDLKAAEEFGLNLPVIPEEMV